VIVLSDIKKHCRQSRVESSVMETVVSGMTGSVSSETPISYLLLAAGTDLICWRRRPAPSTEHNSNWWSWLLRLTPTSSVTWLFNRHQDSFDCQSVTARCMTTVCSFCSLNAHDKQLLCQNTRQTNAFNERVKELIAIKNNANKNYNAGAITVIYERQLLAQKHVIRRIDR